MDLGDLRKSLDRLCRQIKNSATTYPLIDQEMPFVDVEEQLKAINEQINQELLQQKVDVKISAQLKDLNGLMQEEISLFTKVGAQFFQCIPTFDFW